MGGQQVQDGHREAERDALAARSAGIRIGGEEDGMKVSDIMSRDVRVASPDASLRDVAEAMADIDAGSLPVCDGKKLLGMITDRDLVIRGLAKGLPAETTVAQVMTATVEYCFEDDHLGDVCAHMADRKIRRLPVLNREQDLVGIVSLGDLAREAETRTAGKALEEISKPGRLH
jgi:CBS domain-containing protein